MLPFLSNSRINYLGIYTLQRILQILLLYLGEHNVDCLDKVFMIISSSSVTTVMISEESVMGVSTIIS